MEKHAKVVIIGGGVVGCSILYHLSKFGLKVPRVHALNNDGLCLCFLSILICANATSHISLRCRMALDFLESPSSHTLADWKPIVYHFCQKHILAQDRHISLIPNFLRKDHCIDLILFEGKIASQTIRFLHMQLLWLLQMHLQ